MQKIISLSLLIIFTALTSLSCSKPAKQVNSSPPRIRFGTIDIFLPGNHIHRVSDSLAYATTIFASSYSGLGLVVTRSLYIHDPADRSVPIGLRFYKLADTQMLGNFYSGIGDYPGVGAHGAFGSFSILDSVAPGGTFVAYTDSLSVLTIDNFTDDSITGSFVLKAIYDGKPGDTMHTIPGTFSIIKR